MSAATQGLQKLNTLTIGAGLATHRPQADAAIPTALLRLHAVVGGRLAAWDMYATHQKARA